MSNSTNKNNFLNTVSAYKQYAETPLPFSNINNSGDVLVFLTDTMQQLLGVNSLQEEVGKITKNTIDKGNQKVKETLINNTDKISNDSEVEDEEFFVDMTTSEYNDILEGINTTTGELIYEENEDTNALTKRNMRNAVELDGTEVEVGDTILRYNSEKQVMYIKSKKRQKRSAWIQGIIGSLIVIDPITFYAALIDEMTGGLSASQKKTEADILIELKRKKVISKILSDEKNIQLTPSEVSVLEQKAKEKKAGKLSVDLGCGIFDVEVTLDELKEYSTNLSELDDPSAIGESLLGFYNEKFPNAGDAGKNNFWILLINSIIAVLVTIIISSPQVALILNIYAKLKGTWDMGKDKLDELKVLYENYKMVKCLATSIWEFIIEMLFEKIVEELKLIVKGIGKMIAIEKINTFMLILKSLINV